MEEKIPFRYVEFSRSYGDLIRGEARTNDEGTERLWGIAVAIHDERILWMGIAIESPEATLFVTRSGDCGASAEEYGGTHSEVWLFQNENTPRDQDAINLAQKLLRVPRPETFNEMNAFYRCKMRTSLTKWQWEWGDRSTVGWMPSGVGVNRNRAR